jgi:hypothetical protein
MLKVEGIFLQQHFKLHECKSAKRNYWSSLKTILDSSVDDGELEIYL